MAWHSSPKTRKAIGDAAEQLFAQQVRCSCGIPFDFVGDRGPGFPDFTCDYCGQLADVKASPQSEKTGNIAVSAIPWERYPDDMLLVTLIRGRWLAERKRNIRVSNNRPFNSTHSGEKFYLIAWVQFRDICDFGLTVLDTPAANSRGKGVTP